MSQRYSWRCCRGLTEVTACSEDRRHRPGAAAVLQLSAVCSSLGRGSASASAAWSHCCRSMDCSNPSASLQPPLSPVTSPHPCHACHVSGQQQRDTCDTGDQPRVMWVSADIPRSLTRPAQNGNHGQPTGCQTGLTGRSELVSFRKSLALSLSLSGVSSLRQRLRLRWRERSPGPENAASRKRAETGGASGTRQNNSQSDKINE